MANPKLSPLVIEKIVAKFGSEIRYPSDCERLALEIKKTTKEYIGVTTLKRLFGFASNEHTQRMATLDIIAKYAGYLHYDDMMNHLRGLTDSNFETETDLSSIDLEIGERVRFSYLPDRHITLEYLGDIKFRIVESVRSSLHVDDIAFISNFTLGQPLIMSVVLRGPENMGQYVAGKVSGITSLSRLGLKK